MALKITGTPDHALVARVVAAASEAQQRKGGHIGRTALQKMLYFLKASGVPTSYRFSIYHYGPFSEELYADVDWLLADGVLIDMSENPTGQSVYFPGPNINELLAQYSDRFDPFQGQIQEIAETLVPMSSSELELTATLDYLYRKVTTSGGEAPWQDKVVEEFLAVKKDRFPEPKVSETYRALVDAGVFMP